MTAARAAAGVTFAYAAAFGLPAPAVAVYLVREKRLPSFLGLFDMYAGPWSERLDPRALVLLLAAFFGMSLASAWSGWLLWRGRRSGVVLNLALLPVEAIFWIGFALPIPWVIGAARLVLVPLSWKSLPGRPSRPVSSLERKPV